MDLQKIQIQNLNHLGIIAGIIDDIGLEQIINQEIGIEDREIVTAGQVVKAIILNGLGFVSKPLYLFPQFFEDKATEHLIGEGIEAKHLNEDKIGRIMDKLSLKGLSHIFLLIALAVVNKYKISTGFSHLDSSSFSVQGKYLEQNINSKIISSLDEENENCTVPISITHGYSRDHRPDLKQFIIDLIVSGDGDIPLFLRVADGNENDKVVFGKIAKEYKSMVNFETMIVGDSALYTENNLKLMRGIEWLSRVPLSIKKAKTLVSELSSVDFTQGSLEGYSYYEVSNNYGGIEQRWLVVESQKRKVSDKTKLRPKIEKEKDLAQEKLRQLMKQEFISSEGAMEIANQFSQTLKYHQMTEIKISQGQSSSKKKKSKKKENKSEIIYQITGSLELNNQKINELEKRAGRFVLATNRLNKSQFSSDNILTKYKEQQAPERSFGFLKDPLFLADSVFLKSPERIETMAMLMGLCLLVYSLGQRQLRMSLKEAKTGLKNQLGKLTERPTLRWIFQCFQGIHLVILEGIKQVVNLTAERRLTLNFLPASCQDYYILSG